ncbi:MAG: hypothetical protein M1828_001427 [Chrysothrix sp. TS-e1954]|nr:MAG: hypothetical protein M1828_001427 [Chrysothrix sp. TS-e1954]
MDPWLWSTEEVVNHLCRDSAYWLGHALPNDVHHSLESKLREHDVTGVTLLDSIDDNALKSEFHVTNFGLRNAIEGEIDNLRSHSDGYLRRKAAEQAHRDRVAAEAKIIGESKSLTELQELVQATPQSSTWPIGSSQVKRPTMSNDKARRVLPTQVSDLLHHNIASPSGDLRRDANPHANSAYPRWLPKLRGLIYRMSYDELLNFRGIDCDLLDDFCQDSLTRDVPPKVARRQMHQLLGTEPLRRPRGITRKGVDSWTGATHVSKRPLQSVETFQNKHDLGSKHLEEVVDDISIAQREAALAVAGQGEEQLHDGHLRLLALYPPDEDSADGIGVSDSDLDEDADSLAPHSQQSQLRPTGSTTTKTGYLAASEVDQAIETAIRSLEAKWESQKRPRLEQRAVETWEAAQGPQRRQFIDNMTLRRAHLQRRLLEQCNQIKKLKDWKTAQDITRQSQSLQLTIDEGAVCIWKVKLWEGPRPSTRDHPNALSSSYRLTPNSMSAGFVDDDEDGEDLGSDDSEEDSMDELEGREPPRTTLEAAVSPRRKESSNIVEPRTRNTQPEAQSNRPTHLSNVIVIDDAALPSPEASPSNDIRKSSSRQAAIGPPPVTSGTPIITTTTATTSAPSPNDAQDGESIVLTMLHKLKTSLPANFTSLKTHLVRYGKSDLRFAVFTHLTALSDPTFVAPTYPGDTTTITLSLALLLACWVHKSERFMGVGYAISEEEAERVQDVISGSAGFDEFYDLVRYWVLSHS